MKRIVPIVFFLLIAMSHDMSSIYASASEDIAVPAFFPASAGVSSTGDADLVQAEGDHVHIGEAIHLVGNNYEGKLWVADDSDQIDVTATPADLVVPDIILQNTHDTDNNYSRILFANSVGSTDSAIAGSHEDAAATGTTLRGNLQFLTAGTAGLTPRMTIASTGNVGIGTTSPKSPLQIKNTTPYLLGDNDYTTDSLALYGNVSGNNGAYFGGITWHNDNERRAGIASVMEGDDADDVGIAFMTQGVNGPGGMSESLRIDHNGNVGIGTQSPTSKLTINTTLNPAIKLRVRDQSIKLTSGDPTREAYVKNDVGMGLVTLENLGGNTSFRTNTDHNQFSIDSGNHVHIGNSVPSSNKTLSLQMDTTGLPSDTDLYGIYFKSNSKILSTSAKGIYNDLTGNGGTNIGIYNRLIDGGSNMYGTYNDANQIGTYNKVNGASIATGNLYGVRNYVESISSSGVSYGVYSYFGGHYRYKYGLGVAVSDTVANGEPYYGIFTEASGDGVGSMYGLYVKAHTGSAGRVIGIDSHGGISDFLAEHGTYASVSSRRWKRNIVTIPNALDKVLSLRGVAFDWNKEHGGAHALGFIAEEVGQVLPEIVTYDADDPKEASGVDYFKISAVLVEAIKAQQTLLQNQQEILQNQQEILQTIKDNTKNAHQELKPLQGSSL